MAALTAMHSAVVAAATVRYERTVKTVVKGRHQVVLTTSGRLSLPTGTFHSTTTSVNTDLSREPPSSVAERSELEVAGPRAAWRAPHLGWQCEVLRGADVSSELLVLGFVPQSADIAGTTTLSGTAVIRVRAHGRLNPWTGTQSVTADISIAQATSLPVRFALTAPAKLNGLTGTLSAVETYSHYGEAVQVTLPRKCRGS
jgi:hypothetical protein